jgi:hypothetical protein
MSVSEHATSAYTARGSPESSTRAEMDSSSERSATGGSAEGRLLSDARPAGMARPSSSPLPGYGRIGEATSLPGVGSRCRGRLRSSPRPAAGHTGEADGPSSPLRPEAGTGGAEGSRGRSTGTRHAARHTRTDEDPGPRWDPGPGVRPNGGTQPPRGHTSLYSPSTGSSSGAAPSPDPDEELVS